MVQIKTALPIWWGCFYYAYSINVCAGGYKGNFGSGKFRHQIFHESTFENRGKQYPEYLMNRDGFSLLVMGFTVEPFRYYECAIDKFKELLDSTCKAS